MKQTRSQDNLQQIPGVGESISKNLQDIGIYSVNDLMGKDPQDLYNSSNTRAGQVQDRCLLYVFRCAVYYAETERGQRNPEMLKWWNWKDNH